jgi:hypothetical protein
LNPPGPSVRFKFIAATSSFSFGFTRMACTGALLRGARCEFRQVLARPDLRLRFQPRTSPNSEGSRVVLRSCSSRRHAGAQSPRQRGELFSAARSFVAASIPCTAPIACPVRTRSTCVMLIGWRQLNTDTTGGSNRSDRTHHLLEPRTVATRAELKWSEPGLKNSGERRNEACMDDFPYQKPTIARGGRVHFRVGFPNGARLHLCRTVTRGSLRGCPGGSACHSGGNPAR